MYSVIQAFHIACHGLWDHYYVVSLFQVVELIFNLNSTHNGKECVKPNELSDVKLNSK